MTKNEIIKQCVEISNDPTLSQSIKDEKILELLMQEEKSYNKRKVGRLLEQLSKRNINVPSAKLWNELRD